MESQPHHFIPPPAGCAIGLSTRARKLLGCAYSWKNSISDMLRHVQHNLAAEINLTLVAVSFPAIGVAFYSLFMIGVMLFCLFSSGVNVFDPCQGVLKTSDSLNHGCCIIRVEISVNTGFIYCVRCVTFLVQEKRCRRIMKCKIFPICIAFFLSLLKLHF